MLYYSTNKTAPAVSLEQAIKNGIAPDGGLYMPEDMTAIPTAFFKNINEMTLPEIAYIVAVTLFRDEMSAEELKDIVFDSLNFDIPLVKVSENIHALELNHGPTNSFKDVGTRFMARMLRHYTADDRHPTDILVATSGETGCATIDAFRDMPNVRIHILTPRYSVGKTHELLNGATKSDVHIIEVNGNYDKCYSLIKQALNDNELRKSLQLTTSNTINIAAFLPQTFYYFYAYAQLLNRGVDCSGLTFAVPSGNIGNLVSGIIAKRIGLPVKRFIAINNSNDVFTDYLRTGKFTPRHAVTTVATALDIGDPSNFARISSMFNGSHSDITDIVTGMKFSDDEIAAAIKDLYAATGYIADPCGASGYHALTQLMNEGENGIFLETANPPRYAEYIEPIINRVILGKNNLPSPKQEYAHKTIKIPPTLTALKKYLLSI